MKAAATVWLVTAVGMVCGAGLLLLARFVTFAYVIVVFVLPLLMRLLPVPTEQAKDTVRD